MTKKRYLLLEDGSYFEGQAFGSNNFRIGELVFNTNMAGYQEIICDTSKCGQIIVMTYPTIGNYGINRDGFETIIPSIFGLVVSEHCEKPSNFRSQMTLDDFLKMRNVPAITDIDTRMVTRHIRKNGSMKAVLTDSLENLDQQVQAIKDFQLPESFLDMVSITKPFHIPASGHRVVLIDFGSINEILKELNLRKMDITVVPYNTTIKEIESLHTDAIVLSNGPGNPNKLTEEIKLASQLIGKYPILGIGLGHQILALASGARVEKLKVGHMGANYPIKNLETGLTQVEITDNSYTVNIESLKNTDLKISYLGADNTCEGLENKEKGLYSVQFYPHPIIGDKLSNQVYEKFVSIIEENKEGENA
ncbi:MAG: carbamoyl phosphate synthase small subunit [Tissierellia bacterium]|nr:carbamoyl phosphate synthase small subunit [Tissierellia bacterium]